MDTLKFLILGPLLSLFQSQKEIKGGIMGLREDLAAYNERLETLGVELHSDFQRLNEALANVSVPEDVSDIMTKLGETITALESLDQPNPEPEPETVEEQGV